MHVLCNAFTLKSRINRKLKHLTKEYELSSCKRLIKAVCKTGACGGYRVKQEYDSDIQRLHEASQVRCGSFCELVIMKETIYVF